MELLEGLDADTLVRRYGPVAPERAVHLLLQACKSLEEAHARGLVHRDIKPANVFVCRHGLEYDFVKVLDFGLVKSLGSAEDSGATKTGVIAGTPESMAPEIARATAASIIGPTSTRSGASRTASCPAGRSSTRRAPSS